MSLYVSKETQTMIIDAVASVYRAYDENSEQVTQIFNKVFSAEDNIGAIVVNNELQDKLTALRKLNSEEDVKFLTEFAIRTFSQGIPGGDYVILPSKYNGTFVIVESGEYHLESHEKVVIRENASNIKIVAKDRLELIVEKSAKHITVECGALAIIQLFEGANNMTIKCGDQIDIFFYKDVNACDVTTGQKIYSLFP